MDKDIKTENKEIDVQKLMEQYDTESRFLLLLYLFRFFIFILGVLDCFWV